MLQDVFTKAEQVLVDGGRFEDVRANRTAFQDEVAPLFCGAVEATAGRRVGSFLSQISIDGVACEVFVLADTAAPRRKLSPVTGHFGSRRASNRTVARCAPAPDLGT